MGTQAGANCGQIADGGGSLIDCGNFVVELSIRASTR
jgi:hypothetical protein